MHDEKRRQKVEDEGRRVYRLKGQVEEWNEPKPDAAVNLHSGHLPRGGPTFGRVKVDGGSIPWLR